MSSKNETTKQYLKRMGTYSEHTAIDLLSSVVGDLEEESELQDARSRRLEAENEALRKHIESIQESRRVEVESNKMFGRQAKDLHKENEALRKSVEELRGRWEYKDEEIAYCGVAKLNEYGMEGWELVCKTYGNGQSHHKFTFKRRVISSTFDSSN